MKEYRHREPAECAPIPHTDLEQSLRHCERSAAVHAVGGHGLRHCVRNDDVLSRQIHGNHEPGGRHQSM